MSVFLAEPAERDRTMERLCSRSGQMVFQAIHLVGRLPWYIASFLVRDESGDEVYQDVLLSNLHQIESHLANGAPSRVVGLAVFEPPDFDDSQTWRLRRVRRVWKCAREDDSTYVSLEDDEGGSCDFMVPIDDEHRARKIELLAEFEAA